MTCYLPEAIPSEYTWWAKGRISSCFRNSQSRKRSRWFLREQRANTETRQMLGRADIFALASFAEGVPVALMEAMAMEVPCVSTVIAGIPELIRDGLDGLLVPASSAEAMASALQRLLDDPLFRRKLGSAGSKRVREHYNLPQNVSFLATMFRDLVGESC